LTGRLGEGVTATDLALHVTELLRDAKVVGKFVEFYGEGASALPLPDRATIANMAPEYGATMGYFPVDQETIDYLMATGRSLEQCETVKAYFEAQEMFGIPVKGQVDYSVDIDLDLASVRPSVAGPKRPQDRIDLSNLGSRFTELFSAPVNDGGFGRDPGEYERAFPVSLSTKGDIADEIGNGSVLIAAITSCTNTSNPSVMLAAGLLAKKANARGLKVKPAVKTSLAPGSRVVTDYLEKTGLQKELDQLGFQTVGYGCTTCIGNSGPLDPGIEGVVTGKNLVAASVLSGNRNFEARVHQNIKANFLMSPPLVVAFALAGRVDLNLAEDVIGKDDNGSDVYLKDLWPSLDEIRNELQAALEPEVFQKLYSDFAGQNPKWNEIPGKVGASYEWEDSSTYIQHPPFFDGFSGEASPIENIVGARPLGIFGDSVTTDHISPAGAIKEDSPAGAYLKENGVEKKDFNSYGSRRGNDRVMTRGTFANVRIKNLMVPGVEGGVTKIYPGGEQTSIFDAAQHYRQQSTPLVVIGGVDYGMGSSRDWAAKGTSLLGVRAVVTKSLERIHRSNLVGMGVLPLNFADENTDAQALNLDGSETFDIVGIDGDIQPRQSATLVVHRANGENLEVPLVVRIDTPIEVEYYRFGGILLFVLKQLASS